MATERYDYPNYAGTTDAVILENPYQMDGSSPWEDTPRVVSVLDGARVEHVQQVATGYEAKRTLSYVVSATIYADFVGFFRDTCLARLNSFEWTDPTDGSRYTCRFACDKLRVEEIRSGAIYRVTLDLVKVGT